MLIIAIGRKDIVPANNDLFLRGDKNMVTQDSKMDIFSIKNKFLLVLATIAMIFVVALAINYKNISPIKAHWGEYLEHVTQRQTSLLAIKSQFGYGGVIHNFNNFVLRGTQKDQDSAVADMEALAKTIEDYRQLRGVSDKELTALNDIDTVASQYRDTLASVVQQRNENAQNANLDEAVKIDDAPALRALEFLQSYYEIQTQIATEALDKDAEILMITTAVMLLMSFLLIAIFMWVLMRSILVPLGKMHEVFVYAERSGDLGARCVVESSDEIGQMASTFNKMLDRFQNIIEQIVASSDQLRDSVQNLLSIAEKSGVEIKPQTQQVSMAMSAATAQQIAQNANEALQDADNESDVGERAVSGRGGH